MNFKSRHPYAQLPEHNFWKAAVADKHMYELSDLHKPAFTITNKKIATAGSCFAQHIGNWLKKNASCAQFMDVEPAPPFLHKNLRRSYGYDLFSARYGNIYSVAQLLQLIREAKGKLEPFSENCWQKDEGWVDPFRPTIEPHPYISREEALEQRAYHLAKVLELFTKCEIFIFTAGMTEAWISKIDGAIYPLVPGSHAGGKFDPEKYEFINYNYAQVTNQLEEFHKELLEINPFCKIIFTVSPVPLTATATNSHVLIANSYSKSTLRAAIGDFISGHENMDYFPSYEIISSHVTGGSLFLADKRQVCQFGINHVMNCFAHSYGLESHQPLPAESEKTQEEVCDDLILDAFRTLANCNNE